MKKRLLSMSGLALTMLFLAIYAVPARANACDDAYWACLEGGGGGHQCWCGWMSCSGEPIPAGDCIDP
jgi:hypothetical protein